MKLIHFEWAGYILLIFRKIQNRSNDAIYILDIKYVILFSSSSFKNQPEPGLDNTPIVPKFKSFDELLEEKLQLENEQPKTPDLEFEFAANPTSGSDSPKPFLR